jgi:hypothetical protein
MAKIGISQVSNTDTFQEWLDRTNDLVDVVSTDAMTASALGDTTTGDATLVGSFTANTVVAFNTLRADTLSPKTGSSLVSITAPINITTPTQTVMTLVSTNAPRVDYSNESIIWRVGFESNASTNFIIDAGTGARKFSVSPSGNVAIAGDLTVSGAITGSISGNAATVTNGVYTVGNQTIGGTKTFSATIVGSISGNAATVTNGVYTTGNQTIGGIKTFNNNTASTSTTTGSVVITGGIGVSGAINAGGDITAFATSDARFKTNVENIPNALSKLERLNGVTFNWNDLAKELESKNTEVKEAGIIAQEVNQVLPEVVTVRENGYMAVRYEKLVPLLIEAIKELHEEIKTLKNGS